MSTNDETMVQQQMSETDVARPISMHKESELSSSKEAILSENDVVSPISDKRLRNLNIGCCILHGIQGLMMLIASQAVDSIKEQGARDVTLRYLACTTNATLGTGKCEEPVKLRVNEDKIGTLEIGAVAATFLLLSWAAHLLIIVNFKRYIADINRGINVFRWYEYALSSSVMIIGIASLFGMQDIASIFMIFLVNATMNLLGLLMERMNQGVDKQNVNWEAFIFGCVAGIAPWIAICLYFFGGPLDQVPGFVYGIVISYFVFFQTFPVNMYLQYAKIGKWQDYRVGEVTYQILSLVSKSVLAWLVFGGTFQPQADNSD